jgi:hypothetical protein
VVAAQEVLPAALHGRVRSVQAAVVLIATAQGVDTGGRSVPLAAAIGASHTTDAPGLNEDALQQPRERKNLKR